MLHKKAPTEVLKGEGQKISHNAYIIPIHINLLLKPQTYKFTNIIVIEF